MIYRLVSNEPTAVVLVTAVSQDHRAAIIELMLWANEHDHTLGRSEDDSDATAIIQSIEAV